MSKFEDFMAYLDSTTCPPNWRTGQNLFNRLAEFDEDIAKLIRGTDYDPFYDSDADKINAFYKKVEELMDEPPKEDKQTQFICFSISLEKMQKMGSMSLLGLVGPRISNAREESSNPIEIDLRIEIKYQNVMLPGYLIPCLMEDILHLTKEGIKVKIQTYQEEN